VRKPRIRVAILLALAGAPAALAASPPNTADVAAHRQEILDDMLTDEYQPALIANLRRSCALGEEPGSVAESRAGGAYFTPDAADGCVTALVRTGHDRRLPELYRQLLGELGGSVDGYERLPRAIGAAVLTGSVAKVAIGNSKVATVTPALAFDAGFTVAYLEHAINKAAVNLQQLRTVAEACLGQHQDAGTCFSVGYVFGARAFSAGGAR
jgi:hypothetical protein